MLPVLGARHRLGGIRAQGCCGRIDAITPQSRIRVAGLTPRTQADQTLRLAVSTSPAFWTCYLAMPVVATEVAAAHPRPAAVHPRHAGALLRRRDVVHIVIGDVALTVDYYLTRLANDVWLVRDGGGCAD